MVVVELAEKHLVQELLEQQELLIQVVEQVVEIVMGQEQQVVQVS